MICKGLDAFAARDAREAAGRSAEEQLAFYLKRAFEREADVSVFNGLRFERGDDAAQIDHLVMHPNGLIVIESKSVTGRVSINEHGEWSRERVGMCR